MKGTKGVAKKLPRDWPKWTADWDFQASRLAILEINDSVENEVEISCENARETIAEEIWTDLDERALLLGGDLG